MKNNPVVSGKDLNIIKAIASPMAFHRGETLFEEGEPEDAIYVVQRGTVESGHPVDIHKWVDFGPFGTVDIPNGHEKCHATTPLQNSCTQTSGAVLGGRGLFNHSHYSSSAICRTNCDLMRLDAEQLVYLKMVSPKLFHLLVDDMA